jgi:endonuclease/exonuclease/phosphatase (EEP) superfamily protein YafD
MSGEVLSILNLNARARNAEHDRVLGVIRSAQADVVTLIELSRELDARLVELADVYPYRETVPADNNFGLGILSRYPFAATETFALEPNPAIAVTLELPARRIRLIAAHLAPPMGRTLAATRNRQLDALAELALVAADPLIICGDFNLTPYSPYFRRFTDAAGLRDTRQGRGIRISWPATLPLLGIPIDHCFVNGLTVSRSIETMDQTGSDHYPVRVRLGWPEPQ